MKKTLALLFIGLLLGGMVPLPAGAETFYGDDSWNVTFNGSKMVSSSKSFTVAITFLYFSNISNFF